MTHGRGGAPRKTPAAVRHLNSHAYRLLPSNATASSAGDLAPSLPTAVALLVTWDYCLPAWVLYKSIRAVAPTIEVAVLIDDGEDFARLYTEPSCAKLLAGESNDDGSAMANAADEEEEAAAAVAADPDKAHGIRVHRIASEKLPAVASITNARFRRAINKLGALGLSMYSRVLFMDADTVLLQSPDEWFRLIDESGEDFAAAVDQYDGCTRREVINFGISVFRPSHHLHMSARTVFLDTPPCISPNWKFSDQEVVNCMCGTATTKLAAKRHDLRCRILPYSYGATSWVTRCREYQGSEVRAVHYAAGFKPWRKEMAKDKHPMLELWRCMRDTPIERIADTCTLNGGGKEGATG